MLARRAVEVLRRDGARELGKRLVRASYGWSGAGELEFPLLPGDIADSTRLSLPAPPAPIERTRPLVIGWLTSPPGAGSGGHTTMLRMVEALESAGHKCVLLLYDRYHGDAARHERVIRQWWPRVRAQVRDVDEGFDGLDACVATAWPTAHVLAARCQQRLHRFYFVQDFEPFFHPVGTCYALAEDTYHFGFRCITVGPMVAEILRTECGIASTVAEFGCDSQTYRLTNLGDRSGVICYAKPGVARRGYHIAVAALADFHRRHPEQDIHLFGDRPRDLGFPVTQHGRITPRQLNDLYNHTIAGLALSFTNISLTPEEMLAAGTIPVLNDSRYARSGLTNPHAVWAPPTPGALSDALCELVEAPDRTVRAEAAARSVRADGWVAAQSVVVHAIESEAYAPPVSESVVA